MLSSILKQKQMQQPMRVEEGRNMIIARLRHKKLLIVLDDVDQLDQLKALVGSHDWFGEGSRIIITTRDEHLLNAHKVDVIHQISLLNHDEALRLFLKHAHREYTHMEGGLPLALTVLGCFLCDKNISQCRSTLARLKEIPDKDILGKLRISFDGLEQVEEDLFLDIACLFRGKYTKNAMKLLDACGFHPVIGVEVLRQKALIVITKDGRFEMHDLVQEMGHYIMRGKHPQNPEKHSRVWKWKDVRRILATDIMTGSIPQKQLWEGYKYLPNLTPMEFEGLCNLIKIPDFAGLPNLKTFKLGDCKSIEEFHPSIGRLEMLVILYIRSCPRLRRFLSINRIKKLETLQFIFCDKLEIVSEIQHEMNNLPHLHLNNSGKEVALCKEPYNSGCSGPLGVECYLPHNNINDRGLWFLHSALRKLDLGWCRLRDEETDFGFWEFPNLEELNLSGNALSRLNFSILRLPQPKWLNVSYCYNLVELSEMPSSIVVVIADGCCSLETFGDISNCKWLWNVSLVGENKLTQLHGDTLIRSMLQENVSEDHFVSVALQDLFPNGYVGRLFRGNTFRQHLPDDWYNDFCGFLICIVTEAIFPKINIIMEHEDPPFDLPRESGEDVEPIYSGTKTCIGYISFSSLRHTTLLTSSYNIISFTIEDMYNEVVMMRQTTRLTMRLYMLGLSSFVGKYSSNNNEIHAKKLLMRGPSSTADPLENKEKVESWRKALVDANNISEWETKQVANRSDTRKTFVDHLYKALDQNGIHTYKDDVTLRRGESISPSLLKAIEESQIAVIIFSKNYANSTWCLDELTHIMECRDKRKQVVMPIFYDVEPWEVRKQKRTYKEAFDKYELESKKKIKSRGQAIMNDPWGWLYAPLEQNRKYKEATVTQELENKAKVESWRKALEEASNISGWETKHIFNGHESQGIKQIVDEISQRLKLVTSEGNEKVIGIRTRMQALRSKLQNEASNVCMIGVWGVGGGGKTTLASSLYDEISSMYEGCCFIKNIREESSKNGLEKLQEKIILDILSKTVHISRVEDGSRMIMARLCHKKVLIVLDDVNKLEQLKALVGLHNWFGKGSVIIITTRDEHLLKAHKVDVTHQISLLNHDEAGKLFRKHALQDYMPIEEFKQLSQEVVSYAGGLPLALTVLGSFLCDKNISHWRSALARLKKIPDEDILAKLKISFDGLKQVEQELFLDIACFFRWKRMDMAMKFLDACGFHPIIGVEVLRQKALIVISEEGTFDMHDLVQEMGHYIVTEKHPKNPEKHSRVWKRDDVSRILAMEATTNLDNIEAIEIRNVSCEESQQFIQVAANMNKLRWIDLRCSRLRKKDGDEIIPKFPKNFPPTHLCCLIIRGGIPQNQLWEGYKDLPNLTRIELHGLTGLIKTPDFAGLPNLEAFELYNCPILEGIHPSIGHLEMLVFISIRSCPRLRMFPSITRIKKLETLVFKHCDKLVIISQIQQDMDNLPHPRLNNSGKEVASCSSSADVECCLPYNNINHQRLSLSHNALKKLDLSFCLVDEEIGFDVWALPNLEELNLFGNRISRLDFSSLLLPRLKWLNVSLCEGLVELLELPSSIVVIIADYCDSLESFGDLSKCKWLWKVSIKGENKLDQLYVDTLIHSIFQNNRMCFRWQGNACEDHFISLALQHQFPIPFVGMLFRGNTFRLHLPHDWYNDFWGFSVCIVTNMRHPSVNIIIKQELDEDPPFDLSQECDEAVEPIYDGHVTCVGYIAFSSLRHTTMLTPSYDIISMILDSMDSFPDSDGDFDESTYSRIELIPRKLVPIAPKGPKKSPRDRVPHFFCFAPVRVWLMHEEVIDDIGGSWEANISRPGSHMRDHLLGRSAVHENVLTCFNGRMAPRAI
ncbi:hypothetical protein LXL04_005587 [Taraxacum kok-saghyz]